MLFLCLTLFFLFYYINFLSDGKVWWFFVKNLTKVMLVDDCRNRWDCLLDWKHLCVPQRFSEGANIKPGVRRPGQTVCFRINRNNVLSHLCKPLSLSLSLSLTLYMFSYTIIVCNNVCLSIISGYVGWNLAHNSWITKLGIPMLKPATMILSLNALLLSLKL